MNLNLSKKVGTVAIGVIVTLACVGFGLLIASFACGVAAAVEALRMVTP